MKPDSLHMICVRWLEAHGWELTDPVYWRLNGKTPDGEPINNTLTGAVINVTGWEKLEGRAGEVGSLGGLIKLEMAKMGSSAASASDPYRLADQARVILRRERREASSAV